MNTEWWDITDAAGRATGRTHRRDDPDWPEGLYHVVAATCAIRDDGRVLLTQRAASKEFGLAWEFPGGSVLAGESSRDAAARELQEETGIAAPPELFLLVGRHREKSALVDLHVTHIPASTVLRLDPSEVADAVWVTLTEVGRRHHAELLAAPWPERFRTLWGPLQHTLA